MKKIKQRDSVAVFNRQIKGLADLKIRLKLSRLRSRKKKNER